MCYYHNKQLKTSNYICKTNVRELKGEQPSFDEQENFYSLDFFLRALNIPVTNNKTQVLSHSNTL